ncbi:hypothetical protein [Ruegeria arenilitoris]|uniref:hypothetical protein n=1 Tax=Ruegeria arenilitoris TaxID=1173585 RepID=UPI00147E2312|nr:hypothetical protein [Ruegeria arenilitoris]
MQIERARANGNGLAEENSFEDANLTGKSDEKILKFYEKLNPEEQSCFYLLLTAYADKQAKLADALKVCFERIYKGDKQASSEVPCADFSLLERIKTCVPDETEFKAWGKLFAYSMMRHDHFCFEAAERAARIRVSH